MYSLCDLIVLQVLKREDERRTSAPATPWLLHESMGTPLAPPAETGFPAGSSFINLKG